MSINSTNWTEALQKLDYPPDHELYDILNKKIEFPYKIFIGENSGTVKYKSGSPNSAKINGDLIRQELESRFIKLGDSIFFYHFTTGNWLEYDTKFVERFIPYIIEQIKEEETRDTKSNEEEEGQWFIVHDKSPKPVSEESGTQRFSDEWVIKHMENCIHSKRTGKLLHEDIYQRCA
ncbi:hypothetical protein KGF54_003945 [Candida jiufengensis]|uniref:uncharacterized protein n=1 Tax=Candida jiufengensis TaxID=497108 RepID=UPI0022257125|nr:uncharacterized protein KGF54_003945 [Candida jiufengensis]KAI5950871.1 hypothetical protein KGF54_003945 [Candida jiufengensis]